MVRIARLALVLAMATVLAACQTPEQVATAEATIVCTQGGYGPGTPRHAECITGLTPAALAIEQRRRRQLFNEGLGNVARGLNPPRPVTPRITCVRTGSVVECY